MNQKEAKMTGNIVAHGLLCGGKWSIEFWVGWRPQHLAFPVQRMAVPVLHFLIHWRLDDPKVVPDTNEHTRFDTTDDTEQYFNPTIQLFPIVAECWPGWCITATTNEWSSDRDYYSTATEKWWNKCRNRNICCTMPDHPSTDHLSHDLQLASDTSILEPKISIDPFQDSVSIETGDKHIQKDYAKYRIQISTDSKRLC